jgi:hypothetical protein
MSVFNQEGQTVNYQYNAAGDINFGAVNNRVDFATELDKVRAELKRAQQANAVSEETATDVEYRLNKAAQEAKKPDANPKTIMEHLEQAKGLVENVKSLTGLVVMLAQALQLARGLFA